MMPERWERVSELFEAALQRAPHERGFFLASMCGDDDEIRIEVESLIREHELGGLGEVREVVQADRQRCERERREEDLADHGRQPYPRRCPAEHRSVSTAAASPLPENRRFVKTCGPHTGRHTIDA